MRRLPLLAATLVAVAFVLPPAALAQSGDHSGHDMGAHSTGPQGTLAMPSEHLQAMIDGATPGSVVEIPAATYLGPVVVSKPLALVGVGWPVIDADMRGTALTVTAPDVSVSGLVLTRSALGPIDSPSGLLLENADRAQIRDLRIDRVYMGITVRESDDVSISGVSIRGQGTITGELHVVDPDAEHAEHGTGSDAAMHTEAQVRGDGIWLWNTERARVVSSTIDEARDGIYVSYGSDATIQGNRISGSRYAIHDMYAEGLTIADNVLEGNLSGLVLMYGGPVTVTGNTIVESGSPSTGFGVLVKDVGSVELSRNVVADNRVGIQADDAGRTGGEPVLLHENTFAMNQVGMVLMPSSDATVTGNAFIENSIQVTLGGLGTSQAVWSVDGVGNFWSDYGGYDADGDGVGDLTYASGGRVSRLLAEAPLLQALASGPAFRLLSSVEERWVPESPIVVDQAPLTDAVAPTLHGGREGPTAPLWLPGAVLLASCLWFFLRARRPASRRWEHA